MAVERSRGLRVGRTGIVLESLVPAILEQKVIGSEARRSWIGLVRRYGEDAPGPPGMRLPPSPATLAALPYYAYHPFGIEQRRADLIRTVARAAERLEALVDEASSPGGDPARAYAVLRAFPGIGPWTAAEVGIRAFGDADAVSVGDFHLPAMVTWALAGESGGTDERMLELLEPYRGQRGRVLRLLELTGIGPPRRAPRACRASASSVSSLRARPRSRRTLAVRCPPRRSTRRSREPPGWSACPRCSGSGSSCSTAPWARWSSGTSSREADFRGERFADHPKDLRGDTDLLCLTKPDVVREIHAAYLAAGADIISTNSFTATRIAQADYGLSDVAGEINEAASRLAREAADAAEAADGRPRYVAGSLGPTNRTGSISPGRQRPRGAQRELRGAGRGLSRVGRGPRRGRRRPAARRDDLRHAQREGGDLRHRGGVRGARAAASP